MPAQRRNAHAGKKKSPVDKKIKKNTSIKVKNKNQHKKVKKDNMKKHTTKKKKQVIQKPQEETVEEKLDRFQKDRQKKEKLEKKQKLQKTQPKGKKQKNGNSNQGIDNENPLEEYVPQQEDLDFFNTYGDGAFEIIENMSIPDGPLKKKQKKEKFRNSPEEWERTKIKKDWENPDLITLLPTKKLSGKIIEGETIEKEEVKEIEEQMKENDEKKKSKKSKKRLSRKLAKKEKKEKEEEDENKEEEEEPKVEEIGPTPVPKIENEDMNLPIHILKAKLFQQRQERIHSMKEHLAKLAAKIIEDPEHQLKNLEAFRNLALEEKDITIKKYIILSELAVYKDIIPGYKIRLPSEKDLEVKVSKEVAKIRAYESYLLKSYQKYLQYLSHLVKRTPKKHFTNEAPPNTLVTVVCKCLGTLLVSAPYFNFSANIITTLVPLVNTRCQQLSETAQKAIKQLFIEYRSSETVFEVTKKIYSFLKSRNFSARPELLSLFLNLPLTEELPEGTQITMGVSPKIRMSKKASKKNKFERKLQQELNEAMAEEDKEYRKAIQTETLKTVFLAYFKILKSPGTPFLLPSALEGLAKFSHLINLDVLVDLLEILRNMICSPDLTPLSKLYCAITAFQTLKLQGQSLNLDLKVFFNSFFEILFDILPMVATSDTLIPSITRCFQLMFKEIKQLSLERVSAFIHRLLMLALYLPANSALSFISIADSLFRQYPKTQQILDLNDRGSGMFLPEVDDPENQNALASIAWECVLLQNHAHPVLRKYSRLVTNSSEIEGNPTPFELFDFYKPIDSNKITPKGISYCYPPIPEPKAHPLDKIIARETKKQSNTKSKKSLINAWFVKPANLDSSFLKELQSKYQNIDQTSDAKISHLFTELYDDRESVVVIPT